MESLLKAVAGGSLPVLVAAVISNRPDAKGLEIAAAQDVETCVVDHTRFDSRESFDAAMIKTIDSYSPDLVVLAGFMRILTDGFVRHYDGRLLNIHPSLLPSFPGLHTHRQALAAGVAEHGASVHFVTPDLDGGPVLAQARIPVHAGEDEATLAARVLAREHPLLVAALRLFAGRRVALRERIVHVDGRPLPQPLQLTANDGFA